MTILSRAVPGLLAAFLITGVGALPARAQGNDVVAQRGDLKLTGADVLDALSLLEPAARAQIAENSQSLGAFVRDRVLNAAVLAEARGKSWETRPEVARRIADARDAVILQTYLASLVPNDPTYPPESEVAAAYDANKARLATPRAFRLAQIVILVKQGASAQEDEEARKKAADLRAQAVKPKADFAELAKKNSQEIATADKGGEVGWLREPDLLPAVREVVAAMPDGGISQPVRVPDGWHVLKVLDTKPPGTLSMLDAKPQIVAALRQTRAQKLMRAYLDDMLKNQPIQVNEIELARRVEAPK